MVGQDSVGTGFLALPVLNTVAIICTCVNCPACGGPVTLEMLEAETAQPHSLSLTEAILAADEDEHVELSRDCWECGWHEERHVRIEAIDTAKGDDAAIRRAALVEEITNELAATDSLNTLEGILAEIRRQCRLETTGYIEESTE